MRHMGFPLAWKISQSWHFHQGTLYSETSNCCLPYTTLLFLLWPLPREVYVGGVSSANDHRISSVIDRHPISPRGLLASMSTTSLCWPRQGDSFTAAELLEAPQAMPRSVNISLTWSEIPQLPVLIPKHLPSNCALRILVPTKPLFSKRTVHMGQNAGERKGRINSQEPDNSWGKAGNGDLRKCRTLKCLSFSPHGIPITCDWECAYAQTRTYSHSPRDS